jgi:hypothetical protein
MKPCRRPRPTSSPKGHRKVVKRHSRAERAAGMGIDLATMQKMTRDTDDSPEDLRREARELQAWYEKNSPQDFRRWQLWRQAGGL